METERVGVGVGVGVGMAMGVGVRYSRVGGRWAGARVGSQLLAECQLTQTFETTN